MFSLDARLSRGTAALWQPNDFAGNAAQALHAGSDVQR